MGVRDRTLRTALRISSAAQDGVSISSSYRL